MGVPASPRATGVRPDRPRLSPSTVFLLAVWLGLCAGYFDLGIIVAKRFTVNKEGSFRTARDFPWTVPVGHVALALAPALLVAVVIWRRPRWASLHAGTWLLGTLAFWGAFLRLPLHPAASLAFAFGVAKVFADVVSAYGFGPRVAWTRASLAGLLGLLIVLAAATTGRQAWQESRAVAGLPPAASGRNVVLVVWDTVRMSNLSLYGYGRNTTPRLESWADKGASYHWALAPSPWTYPSHASFFTGQWPFKINTQWKYKLDTPDPTLAEFLASRGYQTAGFAANTNCCNYETGLGRGFLHFEDYPLTPRSVLSRTVPGKWILEQVLAVVDPYERKWVGLQSRGGAEINDAFLGWLGHRRTDRPFFAFLNYFDAHEPYVPPKGYEGRFGIRPSTQRDYQFLADYIGVDKGRMSMHDFVMAQDVYDSCIAYLDDQLDRLLVELERQGVLKDTVVVITSDHGEGFGEHGYFGHSYAVDIEEVAVPLVILVPGTSARRTVDDAVSLRDLPATVTDLLGLAKESPFPGRSLASFWEGPAGRSPAGPTTSPALSEQADQTTFRPGPGQARGFQMSLVSPDGYQYTRTGAGVEQLYNLSGDPRGRLNLLDLTPTDAAAGPYRKMLLDVLSADRGSPEAEAAYLKAYRQELADLLARAPTPAATPTPKTAARLSPAIPNAVTAGTTGRTQGQ